MANTYTQIHIQVVFAVKNRLSLIASEWKDDLYKYITGIIYNNGHKLLIINGMPDHLHILIGLRPVQALSELVQDIKGSSSRWINENKLAKGQFAWQEGYGAFSYGASQLEKVIHYIENQEVQHQNKTFMQEYEAFLKAFAVDYDQKYIFKPIE